MPWFSLVDSYFHQTRIFAFPSDVKSSTVFKLLALTRCVCRFDCKLFLTFSLPAKQVAWNSSAGHTDQVNYLIFKQVVLLEKWSNFRQILNNQQQLLNLTRWSRNMNSLDSWPWLNCWSQVTWNYLGTMAPVALLDCWPLRPLAPVQRHGRD